MYTAVQIGGNFKDFLDIPLASVNSYIYRLDGRALFAVVLLMLFSVV